MSKLPKTKAWEHQWDALLCDHVRTPDYPARDMHDELLARIAELEAENERLKEAETLLKTICAQLIFSDGQVDAFVLDLAARYEAEHV